MKVHDLNRIERAPVMIVYFFCFFVFVFFFEVRLLYYAMIYHQALAKYAIESVYKMIKSLKMLKPSRYLSAQCGA